MLSALAKYIFGGVVGDAPETTSMQYETREINDWLLVDMPDQDIDNEDMSSESDDDDILTAVPLLLAEEVSVNPRQIVLSYEPDSSCDKSYAKIRKGIQDKIHSASSKGQVHTGDKIQGNSVANIEAISLEIGDNSNNKLQHNLSEVRDNVKSKQFKSKNSKPKKSKKSKINKKNMVKLQDTPFVIKKKYNDDIQDKFIANDQERPNEEVLNLNDEVQFVSNEIPENLKVENKRKLGKKFTENSHIAIIEHSSIISKHNIKKDFYSTIVKKSDHKNTDKVKDFEATAVKNSSNKNGDKNENEIQVSIIDNSYHTNADQLEEDYDITMKDNLNHTNQNTSDDIPQNCGSKVKENVTNKTQNNSQEFQLNNTAVENNLNNIGKRSYADVVKAKFINVDTDCNKEVLIDETYKTEIQLLEVSTHDKAQDNEQELNDMSKKPKSRKNKSKKFIKNNSPKEAADIQSQNIQVSVSVNSKKEIQGEKKDFSDENTIIPSQIEEDFSDEIRDNFNEKYISDRSESEFKMETLDTCLITSEIVDDILKNHIVEVLKDTDDRRTQVEEKCETIQDNLTNKNETSMTNGSESRLQDVSDNLQSSDKFVKNIKHNNIDFQNDFLLEDFIDDSYFDIPHNSDNVNVINLIDNCQNSFEYQQNSDDKVLENIADLWDIYTKIQDSSDDEMNEIFDESLQENSNREMNENSDEQITDDEMNDNSQDEYGDISDDEIYRRPCNKNLQHFFGEENTKLYNTVFEYNPDEESEESDNELFINSLILPSLSNNVGRKPELFQSFKCNFLEELKQNITEIPKNHSSSVPLTEYELVEYFNFEPQYVYACQSLQYPSSYALAIAEYYSNHDQYLPKYPERCNTLMPKCKRRAVTESQISTPTEPRLVTNTAEILEKIITQKCSVLPTKTAVILEHVKDLKPVQQAMQYEARKYLTRSQLNRQNRNYIYQASSKTNRRRNLQRNHSGVNNNRKCC